MATMPQFKYEPQPPKDFKATMDYKGSQIRKFQDDKQEGMRLMSSGRDATSVVISLYPSLKWKSEREIKEKILMWRKWFYVEIYGDNKEFYEDNNKPF